MQTLGFPRGERGARPGAAGGCGFSGRIGTMEEIAPPASPPSPPGFRRCRTQRPRALPCVSTGAAPRQHPQLLSDSPKVAPELAAGPQVRPPPPPNQVTSRGRIPPPAAAPPVPQDPPPRQQWGALRLSRLPAVGTPREAPVGLSRDFGEMHQGPPLPPPGLAHSRGVGAPQLRLGWVISGCFSVGWLPRSVLFFPLSHPSSHACDPPPQDEGNWASPTPPGLGSHLTSQQGAAIRKRLLRLEPPPVCSTVIVMRTNTPSLPPGAGGRTVSSSPAHVFIPPVSAWCDVARGSALGCGLCV